MDSVRKPSVLFAYYTYTQQTLKVVEAMADVLRSRGCEVHLAGIEFIDPRYAKRFGVFPMPHPFLEVLGMIPAELRRRPGKIRVPDVVTEREYDLVCIGSPTWWLSTNVPIRSFLQSEAASRVLKGKQFAAAVPCRRYWRHNLKTVKRLGAPSAVASSQTEFTPLPGRPGALVAVTGQLPRLRRVPRPLPRDQDTADQPPGVPPAGGTRIRRCTGQPPTEQRRHSLAALPADALLTPLPGQSCPASRGAPTWGRTRRIGGMGTTCAEAFPSRWSRWPDNQRPAAG